MFQYTVNQETLNDKGEDGQKTRIADDKGEDGQKTRIADMFKILMPSSININFSLENRLLQYFGIKYPDENNLADCERCSYSKGGMYIISN